MTNSDQWPHQVTWPLRLDSDPGHRGGWELTPGCHPPTLLAQIHLSHNVTVVVISYKLLSELNPVVVCSARSSWNTKIFRALSRDNHLTCGPSLADIIDKDMFSNIKFNSKMGLFSCIFQFDAIISQKLVIFPRWWKYFTVFLKNRLGRSTSGRANSGRYNQ